MCDDSLSSNTINKRLFSAEPRTTSSTSRVGSSSPRSTPDPIVLASAYPIRGTTTTARFISLLQRPPAKLGCSPYQPSSPTQSPSRGDSPRTNFSVDSPLDTTPCPTDVVGQRGRLSPAPTPPNERTTSSNSTVDARRDARLSTLVTEFELKCLRPWHARVCDIATRKHRCDYISEDERRFLSHVATRCDAFRYSLKKILAEGLTSGAGVDGRLARRARHVSEACDSLTESVHQLSAARSSHMVGSSPYRRGTMRSGSRESKLSAASDCASQEQQRAAAASPRVASCSRDASPVSRLQDIPKLPARVKSVKGGASEHLRSEDKRRMLEGLVSLEKRAHLSPSDLEWADSIFRRLYGDELGRTKFNTWCTALADTPLVMRPKYSKTDGCLVTTQTTLIHAHLR